MLAANWPFSPRVSEAEAAAPVTSAGLRAYYKAPSPELAVFRLYRPGSNVYKRHIETLEAWKQRVGWDGFYALLNFTPAAAPAIVANAEDLLSIEKRYNGIFVPAGQPPSGEMWKVRYSDAVNPLPSLTSPR